MPIPAASPSIPALPTSCWCTARLDDHSVWALQSRSLAHHGCSVLAVDLPGHGRSAGPALRQRRSARRLAARTARRAPASHARAGRPQHGLADRAGSRSPARPRSARPGDGRHRLPDEGLASAARDRASDPLRAIDMVNCSRIRALRASHRRQHRASGCAATRGLEPTQPANYTQDGCGNLFHLDFPVCNAYATASKRPAGYICPATMVLGRARPDDACGCSARARRRPAGTTTVGCRPATR